MRRVQGTLGVFWRCPSCDGRSATLSLLRKCVPADTLNALWQSARSGAFPGGRPCPACGRRMAEVTAPAENGKQALDVCPTCQFVWFDRGEYAALSAIPKTPAREATLSPEAREKLALLKIASLREKAEEGDWGWDAPDAWWQWIPAILGMPIEQEAETLRVVPWATWGLAALITAISAAAFFDLPTAVKTYGLIPAQFGRYGGLTLLSSFFLHGGVFHLASNVYFLLVFGDNVEDWLGAARFLLLILCAALLGNIAHILADPNSITPCIGASGGVSGVLTFYALTFPKARLGFLLRIFLWFRWVSAPAYVMFLLWVIMQVLGVWAQLGGFSNVSSLAHLGGVGVGLIFWLLTRKV